MERREYEHSPLPWRVIIDDTGDPETGGYPAICGPIQFDEMIIHWKGFHHEFWDYHPNKPTQVANAALIVEAVNQHTALVEQRDRLVEALEGLIHDLPADERLATMIFSLDRAERVLEEVKRCQQ